MNNSVVEAPYTYVEHPLIWNRSIELRLYQNNIAKSSRCRNTMVILPTALGKTIIALLVCADMLYNYRDKRILIMAPTRPLVSQHATFFLSTLKILEEQIAVITGRTLPEARSVLWDKRDIRLVFATPEVVRNDLEEGRLSLNDFSLLVFDEAHRAVKDYAYTSIAKKYVNQSSNPVILAMTASPGAERKRMQEICDNLFIEHVEYRSEEDSDVKPYVNPVDVKWEWFSLPEEYLYIISILRSMLDERLRWLIQRGLVRKRSIEWIFKRDLIEAGEQLRYTLELTMEEQRGPLYIALMNQSAALTLMYCLELVGSQGSHSLNAFLDRIEKEGGKAHTLLLSDPRIMEIKALIARIAKEHPKIQRLVELVKEHHSPSDSARIDDNSRILVFTQYRDTARHITEVLSRNGIKSSRFVGQAKRQGDEGMKQEDQSAILEAFKNGDFDVLVATSIAEEGLDIPEVGLVIFYEPIPSEIRYIQRKGRTGRKSTGSVTILAANDTVDMRHHYASQKRVEKMTRSLKIINAALHQISRTVVKLNPMTPEELAIIEERRRKLDEHLVRTIELELKNGRLLDANIGNRLNNLRQSRRQSSLLFEADLVTGGFRRNVQRAARHIHAALAKAGKRGISTETLRESFAFEYPVLIEALKKLEKLKRIKWLDDGTVVIADSLKKVVGGKIYNIYVKKIVQGKALVIIDEKWHARLSYYDYEGPRGLLKRGSQFNAVGELYHGDGVLNIRIKQIM